MCIIFFLKLTHIHFFGSVRWDCSFQYGSLVEEVDGHTAILYHRLQLDWFPMYVLLFAGNVPLLAYAARELCIHCKIMTHFFLGSQMDMSLCYICKYTFVGLLNVWR